MNPFPLVLCASLVLSVAGVPPRDTQDWKPLDPAHLALEKPRVQPGADAEALIWEVRVADDIGYAGVPTTTFSHYVRVKIFTDRGRERFARVDIPYGSMSTVRDVEARAIRPDGTIREVKAADVYRRTIVKAGDLKVQAVSFAVPAVEPGAIVEYRWKEVHRNSIAMNLRLKFSREIPVHEVRYFVRPLPIPGVSMTARPFHGQFAPPVRQKDGSSMFVLTDVPADPDESFSPPPYEQSPWVFISYEPTTRPRAEEFWKKFGKELYEAYRRRSRPDDRIRQLARESAGGGADEGARVTALVRTARAAVRRTDVDTVTGEVRETARPNRSAGEALRRGAGDGEDVLLLFLALADAAGLDARVAAAPNRGDLLQRSVQPHPHFVEGRIAAVRTGERWIFVDPANEYAANGELPWQYEGQKVLVADPDDAVHAATPLSSPDYSVKRRTATMTLSEDGTLEGTARVEYAGHWAEIFREQEDQDAPLDRERDLRALLAERLPGAEVSDIRIENVTEPGTYANAFRLRLEGFAQRTGTRLLVQPAIFQRGTSALFKEVDRTSEVYFQFPWTEEDLVTIELPAGYTLEAPEASTPVTIGAITYRISVAQEGSRLVLRRSHVVGRDGGILFPPSAYRAIRAVFDLVYRGDTQTVVLRRSGAER